MRTRDRNFWENLNIGSLLPFFVKLPCSIYQKCAIYAVPFALDCRDGPCSPRSCTAFLRWLEEVVRLPAGIAAEPGPLRLHRYQRAIADAIADPKVERMSVLKSARIGYTTILVGAIAHYILCGRRRPCSCRC